MDNNTLRYRLANWLTGGALDARDYVVGGGAFTPYEKTWGRDKENFTPEKYGEYIATSNAVYTCVSMRAEYLSQLPLRFYKIRNGKKSEVDAGKLWELFQRINPYWTFSRLIKMTSYSLDLWGVNYWFLERGESDRLPPQEIWWVKPDRVRVVPDENEYIDSFLYTPPQSNTPIRFSPRETVWMPNPNPIDEFSGLAPLAAARLAADTTSAAQMSNKKIFDQGLMLGGLLMPSKDMELTPEQAQELERNLDQRFAGQDKAHRLGVLRFAADIHTPGLSPREMEYLEGLKWNLEDVCRAYRIPLDLVGGQRTYQNVEGALKAVWTNAIIPLSIFVADEITEKLLPMFPGQADYAEFDLSQVEVLQEDRGEIIEQIKTLWGLGVPLNKLLMEFAPSLLPDSGEYPWGNTWWAPVSYLPVSEEGEPSIPGVEPQEGGERAIRREIVEYASYEHERLWNIRARRMSVWERRMIEELTKLLNRQKDSVIDRLKQDTRSIDDSILDPFDMPKWIKIFKRGIFAVIKEVVGFIGQEEIEDLGVALSFDVEQPRVVQFMEGRAQKFATEVNETTWNAIRAELADAIQEGESIPKVEKRLTELFNSYTEKDPAVADKLNRVEMIARTEITRASSGGTLEAWRQSGVVTHKAWLGALDHRIRDTHESAHNTYQRDPIPLDADFYVGDGSGQGPGLIGEPEEDINCRCTMQPIIQERIYTRSSDNGREGLKELEHVKEILESIY